MTRSLLALLLLAACGKPMLPASPPEIPPVKVEEPSKLYNALGYATFATKAGDFLSTEVLLADGGYERNPLMQSRGIRAAGTVALPFAVNWASDELREGGHPKLALWMRIAFVAAHGWVTAHNLSKAAR